MLGSFLCVGSVVCGSSTPFSLPLTCFIYCLFCVGDKILLLDVLCSTSVKEKLANFLLLLLSGSECGFSQRTVCLVAFCGGYRPSVTQHFVLFLFASDVRKGRTGYDHSMPLNLFAHQIFRVPKAVTRVFFGFFQVFGYTKNYSTPKTNNANRMDNGIFFSAATFFLFSCFFFHSRFSCFMALGDNNERKALIFSFFLVFYAKTKVKPWTLF